MIGLDPLTTGITLLTTGLALIGVLGLLLRLAPKINPRSPSRPNLPKAGELDLLENTDAVFIVEPGGKVVYTNQALQEWLHLKAGTIPNLEHLSRRARPSETFLKLCATEGQANFFIQGEQIAGNSILIPHNNQFAVLVTLHRPDQPADSPQKSQLSGQALDTFSDLNQTMATSLDLEANIKVILESVEKLVPADMAEITIWDTAQGHLVPYSLVGMSGEDRHLEKSSQRYHPGEGFSGYLIKEQEPLLIPNVDTYRKVRPVADRRTHPFQSYLGVPLIIAGESIGTLELGSLESDALNESDLEILRLISSQAAISLKYALIHMEEERRVAELTGLAQLAQSVTSLRDSRDLFAQLVNNITPLLEVEVLGFLLYDEVSRRLVGQVPFQGLPESFVAMYQAEIPPGSEAEQIWLSNETIQALNAPEDPRLQVLGLAHLAQAAGIQNTLLIPLTTRGSALGYLQAGNHRDGAQFSGDEMRILSIIAGQTAPIIENANLIQAARRRAQQAEALRKIAGLVSSAATLDEILKFSLTEVARLLNARTALILLLDDVLGKLTLHQDSTFGLSPDQMRQLKKFTVDDEEIHLTSTKSQHFYWSGDMNVAGDLPPLYAPLLETLSAGSIFVIPLTVRDHGVGEMILGSPEDTFFLPTDLEMGATAAGQIAGAIERVQLYSQTDKGLLRKVEQLGSIHRISQELNTSLDLDRLLKMVYNEAVYNTSADCGSIYLFEPGTDIPDASAVKYQVGDPPAETLSPIERTVIDTGDPIIISDFSSVEFSPPHKDVGAGMIIPIAYQNQIAGIMYLHARTPYRFDQETLDVARSLAVQAAIALGNAQRYQDQVQRNKLLKKGMATLAKLLDTTQALRENRSLEDALQTLADGILTASAFEHVTIQVYDHNGETSFHTSRSATQPEASGDVEDTLLPWTTVQKHLQPDYRFLNTYFIPADQSPSPPDTQSSSQDHQVDNPRQSNDQVLIPLYNGKEIPLGLIRLASPMDGLRPDRATLETLEIFASQTALTISSHREMEALHSEVHALQSEVSRAKEATQTAQARLPVLLRKDLEQTISIQQLNNHYQRVQAGLKIVRAVRQAPDRDSVLQVLGQELFSRLGFNIVLVAELSSRGPTITHSLGKLPPHTKPAILLGQRNPLTTALQTGMLELVPNLEENQNWQASPLLRVFEAKSFLCLPIRMPDRKVEAAVLGMNAHPIPPLIPEDQEVLGLIAQQAAITLDNLKEIADTRRRLQEVDLLLEFSGKIGSLETKDIADTLLDTSLQVIVSAHAGMVALWDREQDRLVPRTATGYKENTRLLEIAFEAGEALPGRVFAEGEARRVAEIDLVRDYNLTPENLLRFQAAIGDRAPMSSLVVPLQAGEAKLGVLVLDNFNSIDSFTGEDQALITSLAQQTGLILENARLFQSAEEHAGQLQALTEVSTTITSNLKVELIITSLLDQLATILPFETGTLWMRQGNQLTIRAVSGFEDEEQRFGISVAIEDSRLLGEMIASGQVIHVADVREDPRFPSLSEPRKLSWMGIPLLIKGEAVGVIALEKAEANFYNTEHIQIAATFAGQAAVALENARLYEESLRRTQELDERTQRLDLLNTLSSELSRTLDPAHILNYTIQQLRQTLQCSVVSAILFEDENTPQLYAETPVFSDDLPVPVVDTPLFAQLRESLGAFITEQATRESVLQPLHKFLAIRNTQSLLTLPLATGNTLHGVFLIQREAGRFSSGEIDLARTISNQAAIALENARLFEKTQTALRDLEVRERYQECVALVVSTLNEQGTTALPQALETLGKTTQASRVYFFQPEEDQEAAVWRLVCEWYSPATSPLQSGPNPVQWKVTEMPYWLVQLQENKQLINLKEDLPPGEQSMLAQRGSQSVLALAVQGESDYPGFIGFEQTDYGRTWKQIEIEILQTVAAAVSSTSARERLLEETRHLTEELEERVIQRTRELQVETRRAKILLDVSSELSASLDMDIVLNRTLAMLNEIIDAEQGTIMLADPAETSFLRRASLGYTTPPPLGGAPTPLRVNEGLAGWIIEHREATVIPDLLEDERWVVFEGKPSEHRSAIAVPLMIGAEALGALLFYHRETGHFTPEQKDIVEASAKQITVAINNAQLYQLIRDQAERLGGMLRNQQIEASRLRAILEAVADGVLVTDSEGSISVFNASAAFILGLESVEVLGKSLDNFIGLFGKAGQTWMETIKEWSSGLQAFEAGETFSEQITLEDGRVVAVNLAPVRLRQEFLGTVSIFRDITHQVEVDRLKSEFVATVSHELRTPMTSIRGYVDLLLMGAAGDLSDQQITFLEIVKNNTEQLNILVNDLLDISRIEAGKVTLSFQPLDLTEITQKVVDELQRRAEREEKIIHFDIQPARRLPRAKGDPERVREIIYNIVENSYQYTPPDGNVTVKFHPVEEGFIQVDVIDTGVGISEEEKTRVFERFYRGENRFILANSGTGLGLSIVQQLVEMHGGKIWCDCRSGSNKGTIFSFTIPVYTAEV